jgi:hypothetical protein
MRKLDDEEENDEWLILKSLNENVSTTNEDGEMITNGI